MKATMEVSDRKEADAIRTGLEDPIMRAMVIITGTLAPLSPRARARVMQYVLDKIDEDKEIKEAQGNGAPT